MYWEFSTKLNLQFSIITIKYFLWAAASAFLTYFSVKILNLGCIKKYLVYLQHPRTEDPDWRCCSYQRFQYLDRVWPKGYSPEDYLEKLADYRQWQTNISSFFCSRIVKKLSKNLLFADLVTLGKYYFILTLLWCLHVLTYNFVLFRAAKFVIIFDNG